MLTLTKDHRRTALLPAVGVVLSVCAGLIGWQWMQKRKKNTSALGTDWNKKGQRWPESVPVK